jgi:hypothetical protein
MQDVRRNDHGLCYQTHEASKLVAELRADSALVTDRNGEEAVYFRLKRFLNPVSWGTIESSQIVTPKQIKILRRPTLFPIGKDQYEYLAHLSEPIDLHHFAKQRDRDEQIELANTESKRDLSQIRRDLRTIKPTDPELVEVRTRVYKRNNRTIAQLKILRGYKCQICGVTIKKKDGSLYAEAAHITPKRRKGVEMPTNIVILCPNHHKEFDLGESEILERTSRVLRIMLNNHKYSVDLRV